MEKGEENSRSSDALGRGKKEVRRQEKERRWNYERTTYHAKITLTLEKNQRRPSGRDDASGETRQSTNDTVNGDKHLAVRNRGK